MASLKFVNFTGHDQEKLRHGQVDASDSIQGSQVLFAPLSAAARVTLMMCAVSRCNARGGKPTVFLMDGRVGAPSGSPLLSQSSSCTSGFESQWYDSTFSSCHMFFGGRNGEG